MTAGFARKGRGVEERLAGPSPVLAVLAAIERHPTGSPAAATFRSALRRMSLEANAAGGPDALDGLLRAVADLDPGRADARTAILRAAWADLLTPTPERITP